MTEEEAADAVLEALAEFSYDWLGLVMWLFPWGEPGTELENEDGPDEWQREQLISISEALKKGPLEGVYMPVREATASGHGIGKSALVCWLVMACIMTYPDARAVITANTDTQLRTKTWAEMAKWFNLIQHPEVRDMFKLTATALYSTQEGHEKTWRADAIPWSETNPAAFAGAHNAGKRLLFLMDEASEIADIIWETAEGAMTDKDTEIIFCVYGNPTQPVGRFKEVIDGRFAGEWNGRKIDSRTVKRTNKAVLDGWVKAFGEDSDFVRVRVRGIFPRVGMTQFIPSEFVTQAQKRNTGYIATDPLVLGVDVAWYGNDRSVLCPRRGNDARSIPWRQYRGADPMFIAEEVALFHSQHGCDGIFVDIGGMGAGVYARLLQLNVPNVMPVDFGSAGGTVEFNGVQVRTANKRAAIWAMMREWLRLSGSLPPADSDIGVDLDADLTQVQYSFARQSEVQLEPKEAMRRRGLASPDLGDALALTFAAPVMPRPPVDPRLPGSGSVGPQMPVELGADHLYRDLR